MEAAFITLVAAIIGLVAALISAANTVATPPPKQPAVQNQTVQKQPLLQLNVPQHPIRSIFSRD